MTERSSSFIKVGLLDLNRLARQNGRGGVVEAFGEAARNSGGASLAPSKEEINEAFDQWKLPGEEK